MPHLEVDQLLVEGELVGGVRVWPSQREVAKRYEVAPSLVAAFSKQHRCGERRAAVQAGAAPAPEPSQPPASPPIEPVGSPPELVAAEPVPVPVLIDEPRRRPGRPRKADAPLVPYEEVDRLLVYGEATVLETGATATLYPTHRQLAERYGVSPSVIASYAKSHNCGRRREQAVARMAKRTEDKLVELRSEAIAVGEDRLVQMIDNFLLNFEKALEEGRVRSDNPTDVNTLARLKVFILGGADSRAEVRTMLSLESLQERHARMMREQRDATPEMGGVIDVRAVGSEQRETAQFPADQPPSRPPPPTFAGAVEEPLPDEAGDQPAVAADVGPRGPDRGAP
jgi:hypothetical protein